MQVHCSRTRRYAKRRFNLTPEQRQAKRDRADAARMLIERDYPPERRAGDYRGRVTWEIDGFVTIVELFTPRQSSRRARCDSYEARIGGKVIVERGGLHAIDAEALAHHVPRPVPRAAYY